jgi:hypothetical protein
VTAHPARSADRPARSQRKRNKRSAKPKAVGNYQQQAPSGGTTDLGAARQRDDPGQGRA